jgi:hypothetical protein
MRKQHQGLFVDSRSAYSIIWEDIHLICNHAYFLSEHICKLFLARVHSCNTRFRSSVNLECPLLDVLVHENVGC